MQKSNQDITPKLAISANQPGSSNFAERNTTPPPSNDDCSGAAVIPCGGSLSGDNTDATDDALPGLPCEVNIPDGTYKGVWFTVTPVYSGDLTVSTCTGTAWDTYLRVYSGPCGGFTDCHGFNDDDCGSQSSVTFPATGGTTYYVLLGGYNEFEYGPYTISATCPSSCSIPASVNITGINLTSANVNFTSGGSSFIAEYGPPGFVPGTGAAAGPGGTVVTGAASPIALTGLNNSTTYQVYVRQVCSGPIYSANSDMVEFNTFCANQGLPYLQGFNTSSSLVFPA